uniref:Uncharacterized protein n=1 Tax=Oryza meridionalis TaxID=40149 RepID=A0A0E0DIY2_9ORYZ
MIFCDEFLVTTVLFVISTFHFMTIRRAIVVNLDRARAIVINLDRARAVVVNLDRNRAVAVITASEVLHLELGHAVPYRYHSRRWCSIAARSRPRRATPPAATSTPSSPPFGSPTQASSPRRRRRAGVRATRSEQRHHLVFPPAISSHHHHRGLARGNQSSSANRRSDLLPLQVKDAVISSFPHHGHAGMVESARELYAKLEGLPIHQVEEALST